MTRKHNVSFEAHKPVKEPVQVSFVKENGERVRFPAHKTVIEKVEVSFEAKNK